MVGFGNGRESELTLNGTTVTSINPDLSSEEDVTVATALPENEGICYQGTIKVGDFDLSPEDARKMLAAPINPNGKANHEVVLPLIQALDITGRPREMFIIDFGAYMAEAEAALYEWPFEHLKKHVKPVRELVKRKNHREKWWLHAEARPGLRNAISKLTRYIATPRVAKHRFFVWVDSKTVPDSRLFVFARDDNYFFGILQSHVHEAWSLATSSRHGDGDEGGRPTYNGASTFDTFPFPYPPGTEPTEADSPIVRAIADAARELIRLRDAWLNPPDASEADLKDRTLTKLYNARPGWLANAHRSLDAAVFAAYGWPSNLTNQEILSRLLALNHLRHFAHPPDLE
jgi:type II restriction/modification system DNA methylase subunit YeeA